jgi:hypothetical protein
MRAGGGKQKGAAFEREVCVALSRWISDNKRDDIFWRSAMSGGRSTVAKKRGKMLATQAGDLSAIDPLGHGFIDRFVVECKHLKSLRLESAIKGNGILLDIWDKLDLGSRCLAKEAFLIMKQNNWPILLGLNRGIMGHYAEEMISPLVMFPRINLNIYSFEEWLKKVEPRQFR